LSWVNEEQVFFKSQYYGYNGAVEGWKRLLEKHGPQNLEDFFPWVHDHCPTYEI
jgi:N-acyl-L-homoserine lactone synthetase